MAIIDWMTLALTEGIGPILTGRIVEAAGGSAAGACAATVNDLRRVEGIGSAKASTIHEGLRRAREAAPAEIVRAGEVGATILCPDDPAYPAMLRSIPDPPPVLYVLGTLEPRDLNAMALVGSRRCSLYGREQAERFGALLAGTGFTVVSGGARGVDSAAHRGALSHPMGRTIAVLGCGVDVIYPPENAALFRQIAGRGAVISEYALGTPPLQENFPRRNRIVSGMSRGVLVIEADERSGALITARQAAEDHNRPVFALPGRLDSPQSAGPHRLIKEGAVLTRNIEDILDGLGPVPAEAGDGTLVDADGEAAPPTQSPAPASMELSDRQRLLWDHLADEGDVESLVQRSGLTAGVVLAELTFLSLKGVVRRVAGQTFARR